MKWRIALLLAVVLILLIVAVASADTPLADVQPWMYGAIQSSGYGTIANVQQAFTRYQNNYAKVHNLTTPEQWHATYQEVVTEFLKAHGCASCWISDDVMAFPLRIYVPLYKMEME